MVAVVGDRSHDAELARWRDVVNDAEALHVAFAVDRALQSGSNERRPRIDEVDGDGGQNEPRHPVVAPRTFLGKEGKVTDDEATIGQEVAPIVERRGERSRAAHHRTDANRLAFDSELIR